jgi:hypothetical protein
MNQRRRRSPTAKAAAMMSPLRRLLDVVAGLVLIDRLVM